MADSHSTPTHTPVTDRLDHLARLKASLARMDAAERRAAVARGVMSAAFDKAKRIPVVDLRDFGHRRAQDTRSRTMQPAKVIPFPIAALEEEVMLGESALVSAREKLRRAERVIATSEGIAIAALELLRTATSSPPVDRAMLMLSGIVLGPEDAA